MCQKHSSCWSTAPFAIRLLYFGATDADGSGTGVIGIAQRAKYRAGSGDRALNSAGLSDAMISF